jgi:glycosyltransferase involved in cell wall biosynthesis
MFLGLRGVGVEGGVETHVDELVKHLPYEADSLEIVGREPYRRLAAKRLTPMRWLWSPKASGFEALVHSFIGVIYAAVKRPEVLHIHAIGPSVFTPLARLAGLKVVATHHGEDYRREKWGTVAKAILKIGEYCAVQYADACISVSPVVASRLREQFRRQVDFIPNGVRELAKPASVDQLAKHGLKPGRYVVQVARVVGEKRQLDLIAAFALAGLDGYKLAIVGGDGEGAYAQRVRNIAAETPNVIMTGSLSGEELAQVFSNAALFVLPSTHEGLPIALLEAMSYQLPVLVSDLPVHKALGLPETAYFPVTDIAALSTRLAELSGGLAKPDWSGWLATYRWGAIAQLTAEVYARVVEPRKHSVH